MNHQIGKGITLQEHLSDCKVDKQSSEWMIFDSSNYSLSMLVYPVYLDDWDLESKEYEKIESKVLSESHGYGNLMNSDLLVDIIDNLVLQKSNYTDGELEVALNYYSENDAFIDLQNT